MPLISAETVRIGALFPMSVKPQHFAAANLAVAVINNKSDGIMYKNLLASYTHIRDTQKSRWIKNFLSFVEDSKIKE